MSGGELVSYLGNTLAAGQAVPQVVSAAFPLPVAISGGLSGLAVAGVQPAGVVATANPIIVAGIDGTGTIRDFLVDGSGILQVNATLAGGGVVGQGAGNTANPWTIQGPVAGAVATSGNPVKVGAVFNTSTPTYTTGQQTELQASARGLLLITQASSTGGLVAVLASGSDALSNNQIGQVTYAQNNVYNGSNWDRLAKTGAPFKLPSSAATNNAASIKATAGTVQSISAFNTTATTRYLKLFNTTTAPNPAVLAQFDLIALPAGQTNINFGATGEYFTTGIGFAIVANPADLDNTAIAAADVVACVVRFS